MERSLCLKSTAYFAFETRTNLFQRKLFGCVHVVAFGVIENFLVSYIRGNDKYDIETRHYFCVAVFSLG